MFLKSSKILSTAQEIITFSRSKTIIRNSYSTSSKTKFFVNLRSKKSNYYVQMHAFPFTLKTSKRRVVMKIPENIYLFNVNNRNTRKRN